MDTDDGQDLALYAGVFDALHDDRQLPLDVFRGTL